MQKHGIMNAQDWKEKDLIERKPKCRNKAVLAPNIFEKARRENNSNDNKKTLFLAAQLKLEK